MYGRMCSTALAAASWFSLSHSFALAFRRQSRIIWQFRLCRILPLLIISSFCACWVVSLSIVNSRSNAASLLPPSKMSRSTCSSPIFPAWNEHIVQKGRSCVSSSPQRQLFAIVEEVSFITRLCVNTPFWLMYYNVPSVGYVECRL